MPATTPSENLRGSALARKAPLDSVDVQRYYDSKAGRAFTSISNLMCNRF